MAARLFDEAAVELELAAGHCRRSAQDFRDRDVPHGLARAWAAHGHVLAALERLERQARQHAGRVRETLARGAGGEPPQGP